MANFCTKCGKKLEAGSVCTCEKIKRKNKNSVDLFNEISDFLNKPFDTLKNIDKYKRNNYYMLGLTAISSGLIYNYSYMFRMNAVAAIVMSFVALFIFTFILAIITKKTTIDETISITSSSSVYLLSGNLIAFILGFVSFKLPGVILLSSLCLFIINVYQGLCFDNELDKNKIGYSLVLSVVLTIVSLILIMIII